MGLDRTQEEVGSNGAQQLPGALDLCGATRRNPRFTNFSALETIKVALVVSAIRPTSSGFWREPRVHGRQTTDARSSFLC
jgi:hypothetical protein